jgi:hypothetical protein
LSSQEESSAQDCKSETEKIQFDFPIAVVTRPQVQWSASHLVHEGHSVSLSREIHRLQVMHARVACVDTKMIELRSTKVAETTFIFFATPRAQNASERPRRKAGRAQELSPAVVAIARAPQDRQLRSAAAERAKPLTRREIAVRGAKADRRETLCIGLQHNFRKEPVTGRGVPRHEQQRVDGRLGLIENPPGLFRDRRWANRRDSLEHGRDADTEGGKIALERAGHTRAGPVQRVVTVTLQTEQLTVRDQQRAAGCSGLRERRSTIDASLPRVAHRDIIGAALQESTMLVTLHNESRSFRSQSRARIRRDLVRPKALPDGSDSCSLLSSGTEADGAGMPWRGP